MFNFDDLNTHGGGSGLPGPYLNWQAKTGDHAPGLNWTVRSKGDGGATQIDIVSDQMKAGVVFDFNTIKLGWEEWAPMGQQSQVAWAPGMNLTAFPRPSDDKRTNEMGRSVFKWQKTFAIRVALSPSLAVTWNQSSFGAMLAFEGFVEALKAQGPQHPGKLPLVQWTSVRDDFGGAKVPVLEITDWKDAPDCLKQDTGAAAISTGQAEPAGTAPQQPQATPQPSSVPPTAQF